MKLDDYFGILASFRGIAESPPGSNRTPIGVEFGWNGVSWCAETLCVALNRLGFPLHTAAVIEIERHAKAGDYGMGWTDVPTLGAAVCFDFGRRGNPADMHTGAVKNVLNRTQFRTFEGNHNNRFDEVLRDMKFVRGFATFPFEARPAPHEPLPTTSSVVFGGRVMNGANRAQGGYALVGPDGGVFNYEDSPYFGSLPEKKITPNKPIVAMAWTLSGNGYWLLGEDGGVFAGFGDAKFNGSYLNEPASVRNDPNRKFTTIVASRNGGYTLYSSTGEHYDY